MKRISVATLCLVLSFATVRARAAEANTGREFIMSCTYGVLAGTLVGAASLAFTKRPGDNLNNVARGASLGLYTGILLGLYVVYVVPGMQAQDDQDPMANVPVLVSPVLTAQNHIDGVKADWTVLRF